VKIDRRGSVRVRFEPREVRGLLLGAVAQVEAANLPTDDRDVTVCIDTSGAATLTWELDTEREEKTK
jgi:hypothetical protein